MNDPRIIYINDAGGVSVVVPSPDYLAQYGILHIARKDVPAGKQFRIIDASQLPPRDQRSAWEVHPSELTDGVGGP